MAGLVKLCDVSSKGISVQGSEPPLTSQASSVLLLPRERYKKSCPLAVITSARSVVPEERFCDTAKVLALTGALLWFRAKTELRSILLQPCLSAGSSRVQ